MPAGAVHGAVRWSACPINTSLLRCALLCTLSSYSVNHTATTFIARKAGEKETSKPVPPQGQVRGQETTVRHTVGARVDLAAWERGEMR